MKRPELNPVPIDEAMGVLLGYRPMCFITMSVGQWDAILQAAYDSGWMLLELDRREKPIRAYRKKMDS
ncbi:MAG TPA: hypothetical protein PKO04_11385 [Smithellaceae bacterium]|nr:hypothetical protein [Smithellaceae bacterium]